MCGGGPGRDTGFATLSAWAFQYKRIAREPLSGGYCKLRQLSLFLLNFPCGAKLSGRGWRISTGRILHLRSVVTVLSKSCFIIPVTGPQKLGILL